MLQRLLFNFWYLFRKPPWDTGISPPELVAFMESHPAGRALDVGCGTGTNVLALAQHGWKVTGVDFARFAIQEARRKTQAAGVQAHLEVDDAAKLEKVSGRFDLILDIGCFHNLSPARRKAYLDRMESLLAPGGSYLLYAFTREEDQGDGRGLSQAEIDSMAHRLKLVYRKDGSERGRWPSVWLQFEKEAQGES